VHIAEPLVTEPSYFDVEIAVENLNRYKSPGIDQVRKNCHNSERKLLLLYLSIKRVTEMAIVIIEGQHCYQLHTKLYPHV